jgi:hypothetical protein
MMSYDSSVRLNSAKTAIKAILSTLDNDDFANIITYSNTSRSIINKNYLERVTENGTERADMIAAVDALTAGSST